MTAGSACPDICVAEIGGTSVKVGFVHDGEVTPYARRFPSVALRNDAPVAALATILREAMHDAQIQPESVVATVPGFIGVDQDTVLHTANLPELNGVKLASALAAELRVDVKLERDSVLQLLGESAAGAVRHESEVLGVYFGTGIGAAYLGKEGIFRGGGWALEIGHVPHYRPDLYPSPKRVEHFASGRALVEMAERHNSSVPDLFSPDAPAQIRDEIDQVIWHQASVVASTITIMSPRIVLLGGGVVETENYPRKVIETRIFETLPILKSVCPVEIRWAQLGWKSAIFGALVLASDHSDRIHGKNRMDV